MSEGDDRLSRSHRPKFWEDVYEAGDARWDLAGPSPVLRAALDLGLLQGRKRIWVPGCGRGHDAVLLAQKGHSVVACDFSRQPIESLRQRVAGEDLAIDPRHEEIFALEREPPGAFDGVFEYTCFCAIDPAWRPRYRDLVSHLVRPGGRMIFLAFPLEERVDGPPHTLELGALRSLFSDDWRWIFDTESALTPETRRGRERLILLERRGGPS